MTTAQHRVKHCSKRYTRVTPRRARGLLVREQTKRLLQKHMSEESVKSCVELRFRTAHHNIVLPAVNAGIFTNEIRKCFKRLCKQHDRATAAVLKRRPNFECSELVSAVRSQREIPAEDEAGGRHGRVA